MLDVTLFFLLVAFLAPLPDLWLYPRLVRASAAGVPGARPRYYAAGVAFLWILAACAIALAIRHRLWSSFHIGAVSPLRIAIGSLFVIAHGTLVFRQRRAILAKPERLQRLMQLNQGAEALFPRTRCELRGFSLLALSAGFCEEIVCRGFMMGFLTMRIGVIPAVILSSILFGFAHLYLGMKHVIRTAIIGLAFALIVLASGSLWPAIVIHSIFDLLAGDLAIRAFRQRDPSSAITQPITAQA
jgi:membrane protease YdiL (CAAX protease family)